MRSLTRSSTITSATHSWNSTGCDRSSVLTLDLTLDKEIACFLRSLRRGICKTAPAPHCLVEALIAQSTNEALNEGILLRHDRAADATHRRFEPDIITVTPPYMLALLDEFRRQGRDPSATSLKVGIFGAEPWTDAMRAEIEAAFDMHAIDIYDLSEVMGRGIATWRARMGSPSGKTTTIPRSSSPSRALCSLTRQEVSSCLPPSPRKACQLSAIAPAISPVSYPVPPATAAHGKDYRPLRRHDDRAGRQRVPFPDRRADL